MVREEGPPHPPRWLLSVDMELMNDFGLVRTARPHLVVDIVPWRCLRHRGQGRAGERSGG